MRLPSACMACCLVFHVAESFQLQKLQFGADTRAPTTLSAGGGNFGDSFLPAPHLPPLLGGLSPLGGAPLQSPASGTDAAASAQSRQFSAPASSQSRVRRQFTEPTPTQKRITVSPFAPRKLGSFEKMLTKWESEGWREGVVMDGKQTLYTPHVWVALLDGVLTRAELNRGLVSVLAAHPMLRARIAGSGDPGEIVFKTVRVNEEDVDPMYFVEADYSSLEELANRVVGRQLVASISDFNAVWQSRMESKLQNARLDIRGGPNWSVDIVNQDDGQASALIFTMNHAIEDQRSGNVMLSQLIAAANASFGSSEASSVLHATSPQVSTLPPSMEEAVMNGPTFKLSTIGYIAKQMVAGMSGAQLLHDFLPPAKSKERRTRFAPQQRRTICEIRRLSQKTLGQLLVSCRRRGMTLSHAMSAASIIACSDVAHQEGDTSWHNYKFLLSVDLRRFGNNASQDWTEGKVACAGGAMDWIAGVPAHTGSALMSGDAVAHRHFWRLAEQSSRCVDDFVNSGGVRDAVSVFDWGMKKIEIGDVMEVEAHNPNSLGRAYTCGLSNMGCYDASGVQADSRVSVKGIHFATNHAPWGTLYQLSCGTVDGDLCMTFQFAEPLVDRAMAKAYSDTLIGCLEAACEN